MWFFNSIHKSFFNFLKKSDVLFKIKSTKENTMASEQFELLISYPDGHIEIIEEVFYTLEKAREYGVSMMNQIKATERFHIRDDEFYATKSLKKPYFEIYKKEGRSRELVEKHK